MPFPQTRLTLIQRLASTGSDEDWRVFVRDYWGPIFRFCLRRGCPTLVDAEEVTTQTFEALWEGKLLVRWVANRFSKLRTLVCAVARRLLSHLKRAQDLHRRLFRFTSLAEIADPSQDGQADIFYAAWAEDLLQRAIELLAAEYYEADQGDYVRVFYSRLCERLSVGETATALEIPESEVVNYYRHARQRLSEKLQNQLRNQIWRYCPPENLEAEFSEEWQRLGEHLTTCGGLEQAAQAAYDLYDPIRTNQTRGPEFFARHYTAGHLKTLKE